MMREDFVVTRRRIPERTRRIEGYLLLARPDGTTHAGKAGVIPLKITA
jgi:hypothetical protein